MLADALDKNNCQCNSRKVELTCNSCETCVVTGIDPHHTATTSFDCIDGAPALPELNA